MSDCTQNTTDGKIPATMVALPRWIVHRNKMPHSGRDGSGPCNVQDAAAWGSYIDACCTAIHGDFTGVGFSLGDGLGCVDLDHAIDEAGNLSAEARRIVDALASFTEVSMSGKGLHVFLRCDDPPPSRKAAGLEWYANKRFIAVTGHHLAGTPEELRTISGDELRQILRLGPKRKPRSATGATPSMPADDRVIQRARAYVAKMPIAIEGQDGSGATMKVARALVHGFAIEPDRAYPLLAEYSERCTPPWSESELWHKLRSTDSHAGERGYLRDKGQANGNGNSHGVDLSGILGGGNESAEAPDPPADRLTWKPFPVDALPDPLRRFVALGAAAIGCDPSFIALPLLVALAAAIGNTRRLFLKPGWYAPPIFWVAIVGESGTSKTPAFRLVLKTVRDRQRRALEQYKEQCKQHEITLANYEKDLAAWKRDKHTLNDPPEKPEAPTARRLIVSDVTIEALAPILQDNSRVLVACDELKTWLGSFDKYTNGKGGDVAAWLSMHSGDSLLVDRRHGNPRTIYVESAAVSIIGGIQPGILHRALSTEHRESGLAARLLLASPPRRSKHWTEAGIDAAVESWVGRVFDALYALEQEHDAENDRDRPVLVAHVAGGQVALGCVL